MVWAYHNPVIYHHFPDSEAISGRPNRQNHLNITHGRVDQSGSILPITRVMNTTKSGMNTKLFAESMAFEDSGFPAEAIFKGT